MHVRETDSTVHLVKRSRTGSEGYGHVHGAEEHQEYVQNHTTISPWVQISIPIIALDMRCKV